MRIAQIRTGITRTGLDGDYAEEQDYADYTDLWILILIVVIG
jgi:hypothetical protein